MGKKDLEKLNKEELIKLIIALHTSATPQTKTSSLYIMDKLSIKTISPNNTIQVKDLINFDNFRQSTSISFSAGMINAGDFNTFVGYQAGSSNLTGNANSAMGQGALLSNTTGSSNTALGYNADVSVSTLTNATAIGYGAIVNASNKVRIGNTSVTTICGAVNWSIESDRRLKINVQKSLPGLDFILKLKPITYNYLAKGQEGITYTGLIAQEVEEALQELGSDFSGLNKPKNKDDFYQLRYAEFVMPLIKAIQEQEEQIKTLQQRIEELEKK